MLSEAAIKSRFDEVSERLADALRRVHRPPGSCRLVLATKTQPVAALLAAYRAGARDFGENYVQEGAAKRAAAGPLDDVTWHLIGHLQTNKAATALATFDLVHSLESARLAAACFRLRPQPLVRTLIEVNLGAEVSKTGVAPDHAEALLMAVRNEVEVAGLMTIPPPLTLPGSARPYFARLRDLRDRLAAASSLALSELSMGMTDDYEIAIEEGATIVRVGRAVFGERI